MGSLFAEKVKKLLHALDDADGHDHVIHKQNPQVIQFFEGANHQWILDAENFQQQEKAEDACADSLHLSDMAQAALWNRQSERMESLLEDNEVMKTVRSVLSIGGDTLKSDEEIDVALSRLPAVNPTKGPAFEAALKKCFVR